MKTRQLLIVGSILFLVALAVSAQTQEQSPGDVQIQVVSVYVQQVYPHPQGYKVIYTRSDLYPGEVYLPGRWFRVAGSKGEIIYTDHPSAPYMDVYYENGEFDHVRLFVQRNRSHPTWGDLPGNQDLSEQFSVETLDIDF